MYHPAYPWPDSYADTRAKVMIPSHMPPSPLYQPWPYAPSYEYHGCCNHACYGAGPYGYRPHYPPQHIHPPYGLHAPFPGTYPAYHVPPPNYSVEQPRYDYDKRSHPCCGCNHQEKDAKAPVIKEESQVDKKTSNNNDSSLVPLLLKDRPEYPIMWVPRGYIANAEPEAKDKEVHSRDPFSVERLEPSKQGGNGEMARDTEHPILWVPRGYLTNTEPEAKDKEMRSLDPFSVERLEPSKQGGNGEMARDTEHPILWVPRGYMTNTESGAKEKEKEKEKCSRDLVSVPSKRGGNDEMAQDEKNGDGNRLPFKIFWLPSKNDEAGIDIKENTHDLVAKNELPDANKIITKNKEDSGTEGECETSKKHVVQKVIPVKQASTKEEKKNPKIIETKVNTSSMEKTDDDSRASPKASKLPPVCLRVDPLPRKKKSSRSPSPTAEKQKSNESPINTPKSSQQQEQVFKKSKEEQAEVNIKTVDNVTDNLATGKGDESEKEKVDEKKKKNLSEDEAALIIQSVYRGYEVRKSQPLKKLRQIYEVKKQVSELRNRIQDLETTSSSTDRIDGKKQVIISETIMSLLLKLDTIQGLHPFVREVRKSVAKELVVLQEKLDSFVKSVTLSDQQIMHPEDEKSDQAQDQTSLCESHEHKATESQYNDAAEAYNTANREQTCENQEVESGTNGEPQVDQPPTGCDEALGLCENKEVEAAESKEGCNTVGEPQLESYEYEMKLDQPPTECETHEVETIVSQQSCDTVGEPQVESNMEKPTECNDACVTHEVEATQSQELCNTIDVPQVESHNEKPTECDDARLFDKQEVEAIESQEGGNTSDELQLELHNEKPTECDNACVTHAPEAKVLQEGCNDIVEPQMESHQDQKPTECDIACVTHAAEATASQEGCNNIVEHHIESHKDQKPTECDSHEAEAAQSHKDDTDNVVVEADDMKHEASGDASNISMMEMKSAAKANKGDGTDENEKVRKAMEELMNEQLSVIRELTGRVKDLEKRLSKKQKKKKIKVNKGRRSVVEQEACLV